jgi:thioredoxin reductase
MARSEGSRIAILGGGPIGLEAALYARTLGLPTTVYERASAGNYVNRWGHVRLFTPFEMNVTPLGRQTIRAEHKDHTFPSDQACITGKEHVAAYLEPLAKTSLLRECLRVDSRVSQVGRRGWLKHEGPKSEERGREPFLLLIRDSKGQGRMEEADVVLDCTGTYGHHRWLGDGGIPALGEEEAAQHIGYGLENILGDRRAHYGGKAVMVVGGGYSAATAVAQLATLAEDYTDTWTVWLARCQGTQPIARIPADPLRERDRLAARANALATRGDGNVEFHNQAAIERVEFFGPDKGFRVTVRLPGKKRVWEVDRLIANVGYTPDSSLYRELHIEESYITQGPGCLATSLLNRNGFDPARGPVPPGALKNPEPNFYILGAKSFGRDSRFLLRTGFEQIREVFSLIAGKRELNLHRAQAH